MPNPRPTLRGESHAKHRRVPIERRPLLTTHQYCSSEVQVDLRKAAAGACLVPWWSPMAESESRSGGLTKARSAELRLSTGRY
jgi:hypothetical protein